MSTHSRYHLLSKRLLCFCIGIAILTGLVMVVTLVADLSNSRGYFGEPLQYVFVYSLFLLPVAAIAGAVIALFGVAGAHIGSRVQDSAQVRGLGAIIAVGLASIACLCVLAAVFHLEVTVMWIGIGGATVLVFGSWVLTRSVYIPHTPADDGGI